MNELNDLKRPHMKTTNHIYIDNQKNCFANMSTFLESLLSLDVDIHDTQKLNQPLYDDDDNEHLGIHYCPASELYLLYGIPYICGLYFSTYESALTALLLYLKEDVL